MPEHRQPIEGVVATVLNRRELVINRGSEHGVKRGMRFAVLNRKGASISDPETGEVLGSVPISKVVVEAVRVQDRLTVCRTFATVPSALDIFSASVGRVETLQSADNPYEEELDEKDSYVKVGDPVVEVGNDDFLTAK